MAEDFRDLYSYGISWEKSGKLNFAIVVYLQIIREYPKFPLSYFNLAQLMDNNKIGAISLVALFYKKFLDLSGAVNQLEGQRQKAQARFNEIQNCLPSIIKRDYLSQFDSWLPEANYEDLLTDRPYFLSTESEIRYNPDAQAIIDWPAKNSKGEPLIVNLSAKSGEVHSTYPHSIGRLQPDSSILFQVKVNEVFRTSKDYERALIEVSLQGAVQDALKIDQYKEIQSSWQINFPSRRNKIDSVSALVQQYKVGEDKVNFNFYNSDEWNLIEIHYNDMRGLISLMNDNGLSNYSFLSGTEHRNVNVAVMGMDISIFPFLE